MDACIVLIYGNPFIIVVTDVDTSIRSDHLCHEAGQIVCYQFPWSQSNVYNYSFYQRLTLDGYNILLQG